MSADALPPRRPGRFRGQVQGLDTLLDSADIDVLAGQLDTEDRDPFDRLLAAQALVENATLVTLDEAFRSIKSLRILWD